MVVPCCDITCNKEFDLVYWRAIIDPKELQQWLDDAQNAASCTSTSYDYETSGLDVYANFLVGVSFGRIDQINTAIYVPIEHAIGECMPRDQVKEICAPFVVSHPMNAHNFPFEWSWTYVHWDVEVRVNVDTCIEAYLDDTNRSGRFDPRNLKLKGLAREEWDLNVTEIRDLIDLKTQNFSYVDAKTATAYGCQDSDLTSRFVNLWTEKNQAEQPLIHRLEHDLIPCIASMQLRGIKLNARMIADGALILDKEIAELQQAVFKKMGFDTSPDEMTGVWEPPFDLGSKARVSEQFFLRMGIDNDPMFVGKPTKTFPRGQPSVSKDALSDLREQHEVMDLYLTYNEAVHMRDNFITPLPGRVSPVTGFIHGSFNQTGAPTGRFSHSGPNLAQIPKKRD